VYRKFHTIVNGAHQWRGEALEASRYVNEYPKKFAKFDKKNITAAGLVHPGGVCCRLQFSHAE
jgi:hypothetical protein